MPVLIIMSPLIWVRENLLGFVDQLEHALRTHRKVGGIELANIHDFRRSKAQSNLCFSLSIWIFVRVPFQCLFLVPAQHGNLRMQPV